LRFLGKPGLICHDGNFSVLTQYPGSRSRVLDVPGS
jgi:hypothetical protein